MQTQALVEGRESLHERFVRVVVEMSELVDLFPHGRDQFWVQDETEKGPGECLCRRVPVDVLKSQLKSTQSLARGSLPAGDDEVHECITIVNRWEVHQSQRSAQSSAEYSPERFPVHRLTILVSQGHVQTQQILVCRFLLLGTHEVASSHLFALFDHAERKLVHDLVRGEHFAARAVEPFRDLPEGAGIQVLADCDVCAY